MDAGVGFEEGLAQGGRGPFLGVLVVGVGDDADGQLTGELAHRVAAHAVGDQENVPFFAPVFQVACQHHRVGVLVVASPHSDVGPAGMLNLVKANHACFPRTPRLPL